MGSWAWRNDMLDTPTINPFAGMPRTEATDARSLRAGSPSGAQPVLHNDGEGLTYRERFEAVLAWAEAQDTRPMENYARREHERALDTLRRFIEISYTNVRVAVGFDSFNGFRVGGDLPLFMKATMPEGAKSPVCGANGNFIFLDWCERILRRLGWESAAAFQAAFWAFGGGDDVNRAVRDAMQGKPSSVRFFGLLA